MGGGSRRGCWSELAIHAGYHTEKNEQISHCVPAGAPKDCYELSMFVAAILASILPCFHPFLQPGFLAATQLGIPCGSVTRSALGQHHLRS